MIQKIEKISMNAWPAFETQEYDGWVLRFADGVTKRSNSVNPLYGSTIDIKDKIEYCEELYDSRNIPICFKITKDSYPKELDMLLSKIGYVSIATTSVQVINLKHLGFKTDKNVSVKDEIDNMWMEYSMKMNEIDESKRLPISRIIDHISLKKGLFTLKKDGDVIGCGLGVLEGKYVGLFDIVIDKKHRDRGFGKLLVENILKWGKFNGVEQGYLQVLTDNEPAKRVYSRIGFREIYKYWYKIKQENK